MLPRLPTAEQVRPWLDMMDANRVYSNYGPLSRELEAAYADWFNVPADQVVTAANATLGLQGAVAIADAESWAVPDFTFPATAHAVLATGKDLELWDVRLDDWQLDSSELQQRGKSGELGLVPVMPFGAPVRLNTWRSFRYVVIDAAASLGTGENDFSQLPSTWAVVFSLHATKVLPAGEGGVVVFGSSAGAKKFKAWSNFGFRGTRSSQMLATNAKMSEISAAYALASLKGWDQERQERLRGLELANSVSEELRIASPTSTYPGVHPYWIAKFADADECDYVANALAKASIETRKWWPQPLSEMPAFRAFRAPYFSANTSAIAAAVLGLPMYRGLQKPDLQEIARVIESALATRKEMP